MTNDLWVLLCKWLAVGSVLGSLFFWYAITDLRGAERRAKARCKVLEMREAEHE